MQTQQPQATVSLSLYLFLPVWVCFVGIFQHADSKQRKKSSIEKFFIYRKSEQCVKSFLSSIEPWETEIALIVLYY